MLHIQAGGLDNRFDIFERLAGLFFKFVRHTMVCTLCPLSRKVHVVTRVHCGGARGAQGLSPLGNFDRVHLGLCATGCEYQGSQQTLPEVRFSLVWHFANPHDH